jgi:hypothetical protein
MLCKIWGYHGGYYEECCLLGYKDPVRTSQETHHFSATESSRLMLRKIWGFHGSGYEECRLLGYKNTVRTSQETHYVSATEPRQLMLCKIWGFSRRWLWRMSSSGILHLVTLVRTEVLEERIASIIKVTKIGEVGTTLRISNNRCNLGRHVMWGRNLT